MHLLNDELKSQPTPVVKIQTLDFLRGLAAIYVILNHLRGNFFQGGNSTLAKDIDLGIYDYAALTILQLTSLGTEFVILFFFISGFTMAHSISQNSSFVNFFYRRIVRLWPPYLLAVLLSSGCCFLFLRYLPDSQISIRCVDLLCTASGIIKISFYYEVITPITSQFWSLPYEVIFYLICPIILASQKQIVTSFNLAIMFSVCGVVFYGIALVPSEFIIINFFINAFLFFVVGAFMYQRMHIVPALRFKPFVALISILLTITYITKILCGGANLLSGCFMMIIAAISIRNLPSTVSSIRWLNLGHFSYSLYLFHMVFIYLCIFFLDLIWNIKAHEISYYWAWLLPLPIVVFGCWILYNFSEKQCNSLLIRIRQKL